MSWESQWNSITNWFNTYKARVGIFKVVWISNHVIVFIECSALIQDYHALTCSLTPMIKLSIIQGCHSKDTKSLPAHNIPPQPESPSLIQASQYYCAVSSMSKGIVFMQVKSRAPLETISRHLTNLRQTLWHYIYQSENLSLFRR